MQHRSARLPFLLVALVVCADALATDDVLADLKARFEVARALPPGSRPAPPSIDVGRLSGVLTTEVRSTLGEPQSCEIDASEAQSEQSKWCYEFGPPPRPAAQEGEAFTFTTGGPWLLVIEVSGESVQSAEWVGQR